MEIIKLPEEVRHIIQSGVVIADATQCVLELVYNALDANATSIAVRVNLKKFYLQVVDNGVGLKKNDLFQLGVRHMTSKCKSIEELESIIPTFGYRGSALASIASASDRVQVQSRHASGTDTYTKILTNDGIESVEWSKMARPVQGTTVTVTNLLVSMPVRRQRIKEVFDLDGIRQQLEALAIIHSHVSFSLRNDRTGKVLLQTHRSDNAQLPLSELFGLATNTLLIPISWGRENLRVTGVICRQLHTDTSLQLVFVNRRIVHKSKVHKLVIELIKKHGNIWGKDRENSQEIVDVDGFVFIVKIQCPYQSYSMLRSGRKTTVEFRNAEEVLKCVDRAVKLGLKEDNINSSVQESQEEVDVIQVRSRGNPAFGPSQLKNAVQGQRVSRVAEQPKATTAVRQEVENGPKKIPQPKGGREQERQIVQTPGNSDQLQRYRQEFFRESSEGTVGENAPIYEMRDFHQIPFNDFLAWLKVKACSDANAFKLLAEFSALRSNRLPQRDNFVVPFESLRDIRKEKFAVRSKMMLKRIEAHIAENNTRVPREDLDDSMLASAIPTCKITHRQTTTYTTTPNWTGSAEMFRKMHFDSNVQLPQVSFNDFLVWMKLKARHDKIANTMLQEYFSFKFQQPSIHRERLASIKDTRQKPLAGKRKQLGKIDCNKQRHEKVDHEAAEMLHIGQINPGRCEGTVTKSPRLAETRKRAPQEERLEVPPTKARRKEVERKDLTWQSHYRLNETESSGQPENLQLHNTLENNEGCRANKCIAPFISLENFALPSPIPYEPSRLQIPAQTMKSGTDCRENTVLGDASEAHQSGRNQRCRDCKNSVSKRRKMKVAAVQTERENKNIDPKLIAQQHKAIQTEKTVRQQIDKNLQTEPVEYCDKEMQTETTASTENDEQQEREGVTRTAESRSKEIPCGQQPGSQAHSGSSLPAEVLKNDSEEPRGVSNPAASSLANTVPVRDGLWEERKNEWGRSFFVHSPSGFTTFDPPSSSTRFSFLEDTPFNTVKVPKEVTPAIPALPQEGLDEIRAAVTDSCEDYLIDIKWQRSQDGAEKPYLGEPVLRAMQNAARKAGFSNEGEIISAKLSKQAVNIHGLLTCFALTTDDIKQAKVVGQLDKKFIAALLYRPNGKNEEKSPILCLFDQHAVHERIILERLMEKYQKTGKCESELVPAFTLRVPSTTVSLVQSEGAHFKDHGLCVIPDHPSTLLVKAVPSCFRQRQEREAKAHRESSLNRLVADLLAEITEHLTDTRGAGLTTPRTIMTVIASEACRSAIKFNQLLSQEEMVRMLDELRHCQLPFQCAHGRPSVVPVLELDNGIVKNDTTRLNYKKFKKT